MKPSTRFALVGAAWATALALGQFRVILNLLDADYGRSMEATMGVVLGKPHWRVFQNRILAPYAIQWAEHFTGDYAVAYIGVTGLALVAAGYMAWILGRRVGGNTVSALVGIMLFHLAFAFLLARPWLYAWDYFGAVIFLAFVYFVVAEKSWPWFAGLCAIAVFNRESVYFIALWMMLDPVVKYQVEKRLSPILPVFDKPMAIAGGIGLLGSLAMVEILRRTLLVDEIGPALFADASGRPGAYVHLQLLSNLNLIGEHFGFLSPLIVFLCGIAGLCFYLGFKDPYRLAALALVYLAMIAALMVFGAFAESRIYIELIPILILGVITSFNGGEDAAALPGHGRLELGD